MIIDLSQPGTKQKRTKSSILGPEERKTSFKLKIFFYVTQIHAWNIQYKKCWKSFFSNCDSWTLSNLHYQKWKNLSVVRPKENKKFTDAVENSLLRTVDTFLKLPL